MITETTIRHTPEQVAEMFALMDSEEQAAFFNHLPAVVAREYKDGEFGFAMQMESVRTQLADGGRDVVPSLTARGLAAMRFIGGNY